MTFATTTTTTTTAAAAALCLSCEYICSKAQLSSKLITSCDFALQQQLKKKKKRKQAQKLQWNVPDCDISATQVSETIYDIYYLYLYVCSILWGVG